MLWLVFCSGYVFSSLLPYVLVFLLFVLTALDRGLAQMRGPETVLDRGLVQKQGPKTALDMGLAQKQGPKTALDVGLAQMRGPKNARWGSCT